MEQGGPSWFPHAGMATAWGTQGVSLLALPSALPAPNPGSTRLPVGPSEIQSRRWWGCWARESSPPGLQVSWPFVRLMCVPCPGVLEACTPSFSPRSSFGHPLCLPAFLLFPLCCPSLGSLFSILWPSLSLHSFGDFTDCLLLTLPRSRQMPRMVGRVVCKSWFFSSENICRALIYKIERAAPPRPCPPSPQMNMEVTPQLWSNALVLCKGEPGPEWTGVYPDHIAC